MNHCPQSLDELQSALTSSAARCTNDAVEDEHRLRPWKSPEVRALVERRRACRESAERAAISKQIFKKVRQLTRRYCTEGTQRVLEEFQDLGRLPSLHRDPARGDVTAACDPEDFATALSAIYASDSLAEVPCREHLRQMQPFTLDELVLAIKKMSGRRCADSAGVVLEMIKYGSRRLHITSLDLYNDMLSRGFIDDSWRAVLFTMIPKSGDLSQPSNWRPIAVLPVFYKIFSRMLFRRLEFILDRSQCSDQTGFRCGIRLEDALVVVETLASRTSEWHLPLWIASLDLRKAFDRIDHSALFQALREQGVDNPELALLLDLYSHQSGSVNGSRAFDIQRGVK